MVAEDDYYAFDNESLLRSRTGASGVQHGDSLVRRDRNDFADPGNPHHYYAQKAQEQRQKGHVQVQESIPLQDMSDRPQKAAQAKKANSLSLWQLYCYVITFWAPAPLLSLFGMTKKERQFAWREKIALLSVIVYAGAFVAYLTFGFTRTVCSGSILRLRNNEVSTGYLIINGKSYSLDSSSHPEAAGIEDGTNVLYPPINAGGMDASFLFQNVNGNCKGLITPKDNCSIPYSDDSLAWYFPCKLFSQDGSTQPNFTKSEYYDGWACHTSETAREAYYSLSAAADVYFTWDDIKNSTRNLVVYNGHVLDLDLLNWLQTDDLDYPPLFDQLRDSKLQGYDISLVLSDSFERRAARCLSEIIKVGEIDSSTIGCLASQVVLYISLVFILSVVVLKFLIACYFRWFVAKKQGAFNDDNKTMNQHAKQIEDWSGDMNAQGPIRKMEPYSRPGDQRRLSTLDLIKRNSRMLLNDTVDVTDKFHGMTTMTTQSYLKANTPDINLDKNAFQSPFTNDLISSSQAQETLDPTIIHPEVVTQPPADYMPSSYPLIHTVCFVTCYSEDEEGLRTTLDSLSTTDYPNSHKLIMVVCDGIIKGSGNDRTTPEIALSMVEDFVVPPEEVEPHSYVAVASGSKRHNMAKVYAGFYKYNDATIPSELQQRVPMVVVVKCGTPDEQGSMKPGNRGKRDSQVILMSFLQRLTFDERMTAFEYQLLKNIWQITGLMAEFYELVLMVDADTKVFPDSLTNMAAEMVKDPEIMGLCGETKIANKGTSWVTWIQVFEYYISHHQAKAFESVFGSVTCLPGCFSIYRIKAPKGKDGYWVPILANPDIVERYSDNDTGTLHKKNLLLLGEDRFLSSLMLKTFPKRKQVFVPKAACKTIVPDKFKVLLSQRRRWINSTVHNLMELVLVKDLCGSFCFSMQFVIGMELIGTMVLPLAICFSIYVVIFAIVSHPTPIVTLVLLAIILGLPGLLIVVTATRISYLGWMFIYLLALPIWNFVLPVYAYWKFDDFSWGDTRTIAGGNKSAHEEEEGEFDHSKIRMRTWREFQKEEHSNDDDRGQHSRLNSILNLDLLPESSNFHR
ncbi:chitin synthase CHS3 [Lachancea thermotolerans CBS 6340]|uniref:chitin synthase n=1 Tax=Lachancea thermotolerans (strain ATCC 56472 / CBS 6340 / NRRL Y-8284) TaxID=559295 RepID=C5DBE2_LACTC|nr:KLTH0A01870p [Lachancea thermotolerans CBS 6340]CAR21099.1 KLTH0A01870p [Lachancea thermotolerans CBS 6340]